ncbi:MAG: 16S rRNA (adenine(1518)-N(6)/adenine(1519)-N(6))-dimethyltransferase RsmA [Candidatus Zixiibacteriota bacterium]
MGGYRAKKRLGQNFLTSRAIIDKIRDVVNAKPGEVIIEIGPGRGALTVALAETGAKIVAVEFDRDLAGYLGKLAARYENLQIIQADFLSYEPDYDCYKLVGNLPYNITSPVIDWVVRHRDNITGAVFMVQKEVGRRLASSAGSKNWSPIAIFTQLHFDVQICFDVSPIHFEPPPKVTSSVIELKPKKSIHVDNFDLFETVVRHAFKQRRKTLVNNLMEGLSGERADVVGVLTEMGLSERCRAEELSIARFLELTNHLASHTIFPYKD